MSGRPTKIFYLIVALIVFNLSGASAVALQCEIPANLTNGNLPGNGPFGPDVVYEGGECPSGKICVESIFVDPAHHHFYNQAVMGQVIVLNRDGSVDKLVPIRFRDDGVNLNGPLEERGIRIRNPGRWQQVCLQMHGGTMPENMRNDSLRQNDRRLCNINEPIREEDKREFSGLLDIYSYFPVERDRSRYDRVTPEAIRSMELNSQACDLREWQQRRLQGEGSPCRLDPTQYGPWANRTIHGRHPFLSELYLRVAPEQRQRLATLANDRVQPLGSGVYDPRNRYPAASNPSCYENPRASSGSTANCRESGYPLQGGVPQALGAAIERARRSLGCSGGSGALGVIEDGLRSNPNLLNQIRGCLPENAVENANAQVDGRAQRVQRLREPQNFNYNSECSGASVQSNGDRVYTCRGFNVTRTGDATRDGRRQGFQLTTDSSGNLKSVERGYMRVNQVPEFRGGVTINTTSSWVREGRACVVQQPRQSGGGSNVDTRR